ncbi:MAG: hypothetical protein K2J24_02925 [Muribaculaceae bacterium]|nr:hypothetical protein [Muribaculaceae bacterium]
MMSYFRTYRVGGHLFALEALPELLSESELVPYTPFRAPRCFGEELLFSVTCMSEVGFLPAVGTMTAKLEDDNGCMTLFSLPDGGMSVSLVTTSG